MICFHCFPFRALAYLMQKQLDALRVFVGLKGVLVELPLRGIACYREPDIQPAVRGKCARPAQL
jgi:hypothetical protein